MIRKNLKLMLDICKVTRKQNITKMFWIPQNETIGEGLLKAKANEDQRKLQGLVDKTIKYFKTLQLFCEGHFADLQDKLRIQEQAKVQQNFLEISIEIYGTMVRYISADINSLLLQILDFLIETVQGPNKGNQNFLFQSKFLDFMKDYITEYLDEVNVSRQDHQKKDYLEEIIKKSVSLVNSMLEGNTKRTDLHEQIYS